MAAPLKPIQIFSVIWNSSGLIFQYQPGQQVCSRGGIPSSRYRGHRSRTCAIARRLPIDKGDWCSAQGITEVRHTLAAVLEQVTSVIPRKILVVPAASTGFTDIQAVNFFLKHIHLDRAPLAIPHVDILFQYGAGLSKVKDQPEQFQSGQRVRSSYNCEETPGCETADPTVFELPPKLPLT
jgi:hypothetical protein